MRKLQLLKEAALPDDGYCYWIDTLWSVVDIVDWGLILKPNRLMPDLSRDIYTF